MSPVFPVFLYSNNSEIGLERPLRMVIWNAGGPVCSPFRYMYAGAVGLITLQGALVNFSAP